jgi:D-serine deaminase-like pyridoxal phosphate-dependent protein
MAGGLVRRQLGKVTGMDTQALAALADERVDWRFKGLPADAAGSTVGELAAARRIVPTGGFTTPLLVLDEAALDANVAVLAAFAAEHGLTLAPHGKTTMAPQLFARQLAAGAWGLTAATVAQVRVYRAFGVGRVFLANELVDPAALRWLAGELAADDGFVFRCYVDSVTGVRLMAAALAEAGASRPVDVVVELGGAGGRTGCRTDEEARAVADAVAGAGRLRLVGVAGYEGAVADVDRFLVRLRGCAEAFDAEGRFEAADQILVSAGGSAHPDAVGRHLGGSWSLSRPVLALLRSGAYASHDDGLYARISPLREVLRPALRLWTRVLSRPEPGLALLDFGKRDAPFDEGLPVVLWARRSAGSAAGVDGFELARMNDQHAFLAVPPDSELAVGDLVCCGISHPCTAFDKWQLIPLVGPDGTAVDYIRTFF